MDAKRNTQEEYDAYDQVNNDPRLVDTDFIENQGLSAKATNFDKGKKATTEAAILEEQYLREEEIAQEQQLEQDYINRQIAFARRQAVQLQQSKARGIGSKARGASAFGRWAGTGVAVTAFFCQLLFAIISLIGFFAKGAISHILNETTIGKVVNKFVGFFFDIEKLFPIEYLAMAFWGLAMIIAFCTFLAFLLIFIFSSVKVFRGTLSLLIMAFAFASSIIPLLPGVLLWIIYVNATASLDALKTLKGAVSGGAVSTVRRGNRGGTHAYRPSSGGRTGQASRPYRLQPDKKRLQGETPQFVREFSREKSQEERDALAVRIRGLRQERDLWRTEHNELTQEEESLVGELGTLENEIESHNNQAFFQKISDYFSYRRMKVDLLKRQETLTEVRGVRATHEATPPQFEEPKRLIEEFYQGEEKKWAEAGYSKEDIQTYFSEENLSKLTLEEYALLMRRFPGEMVTHITRQGIRDHYDMFEHTGGLGEHHDGLKSILQSGRLLAPFGAALSQFKTNKDILAYMNHYKFPYDEALPAMIKTLKRLKDTSFTNDKSAIHFAVQDVVDHIYGGERDNEVFFAYPSAMVASQMKFSSDPTVPIERASSKHNDVFVWADERQGIDINAGITFIPKNALVDPENGSLYQRDAEGLPIEEQVQEEEKNPNHLYYKRAQSQVPSQEYWEKYFVEHPDQRPTKIVYYDTSLSPTEALWKWKEDNGIIKQGTSEALGFTANQESRDSHRTDQDYIKDLNAILLRALAVEYPITSIVAQYNADRGGYPQTKEDLERVVQEINMTDV